MWSYLLWKLSNIKLSLIFKTKYYAIFSSPIQEVIWADGSHLIGQQSVKQPNSTMTVELVFSILNWALWM